MGKLMRELDWAATALGPSETWSQSLRMVTCLLLANRFPLLLWWGPEFCQLYNNPYCPILGAKHPRSMGQPASICWAEIWHIIGPLIETPFNGGAATWMDDLLLEINRHGFVEETHFTVAYSPVPDETAPRGIGGVLATVHEITEKVIGERRVLALRDLGVRAAEAKSAEVACATIADTLADDAKDVPFALLYLVHPESQQATLEGAVGVAQGMAVSPRFISLADNVPDRAKWPLLDAMRADAVLTVTDLGSRFVDVPPGPWSDPPNAAIIVPVRSTKAREIAAFLVAGLSPRLRFDDLYRSFFELLAVQIATAIANARACEEERRRAEALAEIDRAKTAFFSNVSHEFRTPLTLMLSPIEELLSTRTERLSPEGHELLEIARRNSLRLLRLVNMLLDFSRVEAGRVQASFEPVDLATFTQDLVSNFRSACERAGLTLHVDCPALLEPVFVDREKWEKIVLNLVSNAFKFTLNGRIDVMTRVNGKSVELAVSDTGIGIADVDLPRIFERFYRVEGRRGRTHEGTGIGLALVQELVRLHGGDIRVESTVGEGTTFTVTVPRGCAHLPDDRINAHPSLASTAVGAHAFVEEALRWLPTTGEAGIFPTAMNPDIPAHSAEGPRDGEARVLLADDNADMRDYMTRLLSSSWEVEAVADGRAALDAARRHKPDLVLTDVMMPRLDGMELLSQLRCDPVLGDVPVIFISARAGEGARIEGLDAGADDYLVKPFSGRELIARVGSSLALSRLRADEQAATSRLRELSTRLTAASDLPSLLHEVLDATMQLQRADFGDVQLYNKETCTLEIVAQRGFQSEFLDYFRSVDATDDTACGLALRHRRRIIIEDVDLDPDFEQHRGLAARAGFRAVQSTPLFDRRSGEPLGMLSTHFRNPHRPSARDLRLTDLYASQAADVIVIRLSEQRLRDSEARLAAILAQIPVGVGLFDWDGRLGQSNIMLRRLCDTGSMPSQNPKEQAHWRAFDAGGRRLELSEYPGARALRGETVLPGVDFIHTANGRERWVRVSCTPYRDEAGEITGVLTVVQDIDEEKRAAQANVLLIKELQHRTRNLLAVVDSLSTETLASSGSLEGFATAFSNRLASLSRVQSLVSRDQANAATMAELVRLELRALGTEADGKRIVVEGPEVTLSSRTVQIVALALHELATNARKHGALSTPDGVLSVTWRVTGSVPDHLLELEWHESGLTKDKSNVAPIRMGFGRRLIEESLPFQLDAHTRLEFGNGEVRCSITMALDIL
jgi:signal transduction histidine kinase/DNA-binding response OmpR family regulator